MISAKLEGGIGNQMFTIAATYSLALRNNDECAFNFDEKVVDQGNIARTYITNVYKKLKELPKSWSYKAIYHDRAGIYEPIWYRKNLMIQGGYFSEQYFIKHKKEVIRLFKDEATISQIKGQFTNSASLHVRRGDFLRFSKYFAIMPVEYYIKAIAFLDKVTFVDKIYVLSDDIKWCKANLKDPRIEFIEGMPDYIDLYIMTKCRYNILANSTFSWWGAYLNENEGRIICAPTEWFAPSYKVRYSDTFCDCWIKIKIKNR